MKYIANAVNLCFGSLCPHFDELGLPDVYAELVVGETVLIIWLLRE